MTAKLITIPRTGATATVQPLEPTGDLVKDACAALRCDVETLTTTLLPGEAQTIVDIAHDLWAASAHRAGDPDAIRKLWKDYLK